MVDVTLAVTIKPAVGAVVRDGCISYEQIDAGCAVYKRSDGKWAKSRANAAATSLVDGVAVSTAEGADQRFSVVETGDLTTTGLTQGQTLYLSAATAGKLAPEADLTTGNYVTIVGVSKSTTAFSVHPFNTGATKP